LNGVRRGSGSECVLPARQEGTGPRQGKGSRGKDKQLPKFVDWGLAEKRKRAKDDWESTALVITKKCGLFGCPTKKKMGVEEETPTGPGARRMFASNRKSFGYRGGKEVFEQRKRGGGKESFTEKKKKEGGGGKERGSCC